MKIVHAADVHLGRRRLEGRLPEQDLADAFAFVATQAIEERADVFLIAGDLFDRAQVEPPHLRQAHEVLKALKQAGIPVIAIEGNHDKAFIHSDNPSWLRYLAEDDLLVLLRTQFGADGPLLTQWEDSRRGGAWIDLKGVRFVGAGYLGAATPHKVRQIAAGLEPGRTHVMLLHAGPEYFVGEGGGFSKEDLAVLKERVCYLALGHIHKPMRHQDWGCNPGSLEHCDLREAAYPGPRGYAVVELDPGRAQKPISIEIRDTPRRPCFSLTLDCTPFGNKLKHGAAALVEAAVKLIQGQIAAPVPSLSIVSSKGTGQIPTGENRDSREDLSFSSVASSRGDDLFSGHHTTSGPSSQNCVPSRTAVVELRLTGKLNLDRIALDQAWAAAEIERAAGLCAVSFDTTGLNVDGLVAAGLATPETLTRELLEKAAIRNLVEGEHLWGLDGRQEEFAALFYELKESVRGGRTGEELAEQIGHSPLVELIRTAL